MTLRQIGRAACQQHRRPALSLLSIYTSCGSSSSSSSSIHATSTAATLPPRFLLPCFSNHERIFSTPFHVQRRHASVNFPVAPTLGPQFIDEERVRYPYDDEITCHNPMFIDENGKSQGQLPIGQILRSYNRREYHLIWLSDPDGRTDESEGHIVRLFSKEMLRERISKEKAAADVSKKGKKDPRGITKELQLSWAIDYHDLLHRLGKVEKLLEKGNKVEIMIARKKGQAKVTTERLDEMMEIINDFMEMKGGEQFKKMEGEVGGPVRLYIQRPVGWIPPPPKPEPVVVEGENQGVGEEHVPDWQVRGEVHVDGAHEPAGSPGEALEEDEDAASTSVKRKPLSGAKNEYVRWN